MSKIFEEKLSAIGITLSDVQKKQFHQFYELLVEWNKVMNLTGITEYEEVNEKHFVDSLSLVKAIDVKNVKKVIDTLGLEKIKTIHGRAEDFAKQAEYREQFDLCVSRAVANLSTLSEYCLPYVKVGGLFVPYKSGEIDEEVLASKKAIHILGGKLEDVIKFQLPGTEIGRSFVKIEKNKNTSKKYPRKAGLPAKEPLS